MKALAERRARVARVRRVQHLRAVSAAATAEGRVVQLEGNAQRLAAMRAGLTHDVGVTSGAALGNAAELQARLETAAHGLSQAIGSAREAAALRAQERLGAHIALEGAERLETRAVAAMQDMIEARMAAAFVPRGARGNGNG